MKTVVRRLSRQWSIQVRKCHGCRKKELLAAGITVRGKKRFTTATKQIVERDFGYAILKAEGYATNDEIVFAEEGDMSLLGVRTIEGFSVMVDNIGHRFVATTSLVCIMTDNEKID
jgi:hypothetical protein